MKRKLIIIPVSLALFAINGCISGPSSYYRYYVPAEYEQEISYHPKPMSSDAEKKATYLSATYRIAGGEGDAKGDQLSSGKLEFQKARTFTNVNLAYGVYGFTGDYTNNGVDGASPSHFNDKSFYGGGANLSANMYVTNGRVDFRYLGAEVDVSQEYGSYSAWRKYAQSAPVYINPNGFETDHYAGSTVSGVYKGGLTSELIFHGRQKTMNQFGLRAFVGTAFNGGTVVNGTQMKDVPSGIFTLQYFMQVNHVQFNIGLGNQSFGLRGGYRF